MSFRDHKKYLLTTILYMIFNSISYSQVDSSKFNNNEFVFSPSVHNIQIDAVTIILLNQIGAEFDFDILRRKNKNTCVGIRLSIEHYYLINFVDKVDGSPFTDYNLYARISTVTDDFLISVLGGVTYYTSDDPTYLPSKYLFRAGFEVKYGSTLGFIFKGSTSLVKYSSFIGIGMYLGFGHN